MPLILLDSIYIYIYIYSIQRLLIDRPFKRVAVDLIGPIAPFTDRGNRYILNHGRLCHPVHLKDN